MGQAFAPGSYIHANVNTRNIARATLRISRITPEAYVEARRLQADSRRSALSDLKGEVEREVKVEGIVDEGKYIPWAKEIYLDPLKPGIYKIDLLAPVAPAQEANENFARQALVSVTALAVAARHDGLRSEVFVADADTGVPVKGARVWLLAKYGYDRTDQKDEWRLTQGETGENGIAKLDCPAPPPDERGPLRAWILAEKDGQCASTEGWRHDGQPVRAGETQPGEPVLYAYSDRPAYRPGEPIHWKAILRYTDGKDYSLPQMKSVYVMIRDARGGVVHEKEYPLNEYGSFEGTFSVDRKAALGVMNIEVLESKAGRSIQSAALCRIEEYKLPEYKVSVEPGKEQVRFGQAVPFEIRAEYYFGGPVAGAEVEVVVRRNAFWPRWEPISPYPWLYERSDGGYRSIGRSEMFFPRWPRHEPEKIILTQKLKTDDKGAAKVMIGALSEEEIKQARDREIWGYEYQVEARVVDPSRREVRETGTIKTARTAFAAYLTPKCFLYLPGDTAKVEVRTLDPNDRPVAAEAFVTVFKRNWNKELKNGKGEAVGGYDDTKLFARPIRTEAKDESKENPAILELQLSEPGCYLLRYETQDAFGEKVTGETTIFVATQDTTQVGYRSGGVTIVTDKETYERGETAHVLLAVRRPGAAVWFAAEGGAVHSSQVVRPTGTVKMIDVPITQDFEPNIFFTALSMFDYSGFRDTKRLVIPPTRRFLSVTIRTAKQEFRPGEKAAVEVEVKDAQGRPVQTELSLGIADAAVWAIGSDLAPDIRQAFWSQTRGLETRTDSSAERVAIELWRPKKDKPGEFERVMREGIVAERQTQEGVLAARGMSMGGAMSMAVPASAPMDAMARVESNAPQEYFFGYAAKGVMASGGDVKRLTQVEEKFSQAMAPARVRKDFSATALWLPSLVTDAQGRAKAEVTFPDSLTSWKLTARAADKETRVGEVRRETKTNKPVMVRPQGPRFFIQGDEVTLSAIVNNNTTAPLSVEVALDPKGLRLAKFSDAETTGLARALDNSTEPVPANTPRLTILVPAGNQRRVDWRVAAETPGEARIKTEALSAADSDAVEKTFPIYEYGIEQFIAAGTSIREKAATVEKTMTLEIPAERREGSEGLTLTIEPTLARAMVGALDYLADYPYGCIEQTLSRFVPAVITAKVLGQLGLSRPELEKKLPDMIEAGLNRIYDFQHADGGWAWWKEGESDPYMTAYVVQGLAQALDAGVQVKGGVINRAAEFLENALVKYEKEPDMGAFMLYALASLKERKADGPKIEAAFNRIWAARQDLNPYTRALFALACHATNRTEWTRVLARNMNNGLIVDRENGTAHWGEAGIYYRWSEGGVEATAFGLRALLAIDPASETIDQAVAWLVRNRRGNRWKNTKDTAIMVGALADYIIQRKEDQPDWTAEVRINGELVKTLMVTPGRAFEFDGKIEIPAAKLRTGKNTITIKRKGTGVLYASAWLTYFTRQGEIKPAGNEVFVQRRYFRARQEPTLAGEYKQVREEIKPGQWLASGDRVEVELNLEAKNHYEYLVIEDQKAAGMEATEVQSGFAWGGGLAAHRELRDEKTAFFVTSMPEGKHLLKYELRAEVPGIFHALPALVHAMYVPEIRANSAGARIQIKD